VKRILVVEDNELNRDVLSRRLARRGFEVLVAIDGANGLEVVDAAHPDLILLDLAMPHVDGWECARRLKAREQTRAIPIIALSAHAMLGERQKALDAGCDDFDTKPLDFPALLEKMDRLLQPAPEGL
jgi:two-component system, cell cycle response regulator DivK